MSQSEDAKSDPGPAHSQDTLSVGSSNKAQLATEEDSNVESTEHDLTEAMPSSDSKELIPAPHSGSTADVVSIATDDVEGRPPLKYREEGCARCWTRTLQYRRIWAVVVVLLGVTLTISGMAANWEHNLVSPGVVIMILGGMVFCIDSIRKSRRKQHRHYKGPKISLLKTILTPRPEPSDSKSRLKLKKKKESLVEADSHGEHASTKVVHHANNEH